MAPCYRPRSSLAAPERVAADREDVVCEIGPTVMAASSLLATDGAGRHKARVGRRRSIRSLCAKQLGTGDISAHMVGCNKQIERPRDLHA